MCDAAVSIALKYIDQHLFSPSFSWSKYEFEKRTYSRWAAYEIINRIMDKPFDMPSCIIEEFMTEMSMYACYGKDKHRSWIFQVAAETAEEMLSLFV